MRFPGFKTKAVTLSYDDGKIFDRKMIEILNHYGVKCTFNLNSKYLNSDGTVTTDEINGLYKGHEIAVHTYSHPHLENLDDAVIANEIIKDRENLEDITQKIIKGMAYPFGLNDDRVLNILRNCGIEYARTTRCTSNFSLPHTAVAKFFHHIQIIFDPLTKPLSLNKQSLILKKLNPFSHLLSDRFSSRSDPLRRHYKMLAGEKSSFREY